MTRIQIIIPLILAVLLSADFIYAFELKLSSYAYTFNNADFRAYNKNTYEDNKSADYLNTDDRSSFIYSNLAFDYSKKYKSTELFISVYRSGFWGTDNLEGRDDGKNPILFSKLYYNYFPFKGISMSLGRFYYSIGESENDYFLSDTIDGLLLKFKINQNIEIETEIDVLGIGSRPDGTRIWFGIEKDDEIVEDFNGDVISFRGGAAAKIFNVKIFSYFLRYGASSKGGADISENGKSVVNMVDQDFLSLNGARFFYDFERFGRTDFTVAYSYGKDYQYAGEHTYNGFAAALNHSAPINLWILKKGGLSAGYFHPDFCAMKAQSMGGILLWAYKGYFASPYSYFYHFTDYAKRKYGQTTIDKTVSKTFARADLEFIAGKFKFLLGSLVLFANEEAVDPIFMGLENQLDVSVDIDNLTFAAAAAIYLPSSYYSKRSKVNTFVPGGSDPFFGLSLSSVYKLGWN